MAHKERDMTGQETTSVKKQPLQNSDLVRRCGRCQRTIDRWKGDGTLPPPDFVINRAPYWYEETIETNERTRLSSKAPEAA
jgi:hypothetical protein